VSREVTLHLRPLREGDGAGPAAAWSSSTFESERRAMQELESPVEPLRGPWLARVERTGALTADGLHYKVCEGVRNYVVREGVVVPLPTLHRRKGSASWLRTRGPDIVQAWEAAEEPFTMTDWLRTVDRRLHQRACDADPFDANPLATPEESCRAIREAVTIDEIALELERREAARRIARSSTIRQIDEEATNATALTASGDVVSLQLAPDEVEMVKAGTPLYLGADGLVRARPSERAPEAIAYAVMPPSDRAFEEATRAAQLADARVAADARRADFAEVFNADRFAQTVVAMRAAGYFGEGAEGDRVARELLTPAAPVQAPEPSTPRWITDKRGMFWAYEEPALALSPEAYDVLERRSRSELLTADLRRFVGAPNTAETRAAIKATLLRMGTSADAADAVVMALDDSRDNRR